MLKQLEDSGYTALIKELLDTKGSDLQREFIAQVHGRGFCEWIRTRIRSQGDVDIPYSKDFKRLTKDEYKDPPLDTEKELYKQWDVLTPADACKPTLWGGNYSKFNREKNN